MKVSTLFNPMPQHETLRTIVVMRVVALGGQLLVVVAAQYWLGINLALMPLFGTMLCLAAFNGWTWRRMHRVDPANHFELFLQLLMDVLALSALLYFSGGATNPFVSFYLPALAVAAAILPPLHAVALAVFSIVCYSLLTSYYVPLHIADPDRAVTYHLSGMWANFALSAGLITWFVARMSRALRTRDAQLTQAREHHMQGERIIALGTQAASAAHEMGTPLATVALITDELRHETKYNPALAAYSADLQTIEAQIALCKTALARMGMQVGAAAETDADVVDLPEWLTQFVAQWRLCHPTARLQFTLAAGACRIVHSRAVGQMLQTLLDNARYASAAGDTTIHVSLALQARAALVQVTDAGMGIAPALVNRLGYEAVQSTSGGKGIGLMLAFATARQIGATLVLSSAKSQGTSATITLALA